MCTSRSWELITTLLAFLKPLYSKTLCTVLRTSLQEKTTKTKVERIQSQGGGAHDTWRVVRELCLCGLEKKRLRGDLIAVFHLVMGGYRGDRDRLFLEIYCERMRNNLLQERFWPDERERRFSWREWSGSGTNCPEWLWDLCPSRHWQLRRMRPWATRSNLEVIPVLNRSPPNLQYSVLLTAAHLCGFLLSFCLGFKEVVNKNGLSSHQNYASTKILFLLVNKES